MHSRRLDREICDLALHQGRQRFLPIHGPSYEILRGFGIFNAGLSRHRPPFDICRVKQEWHSVFFCISGEAIFITKEGELELAAGEMLHIPPGCANRYWTESEWEYVWINFHDAGWWRSRERKNASKRTAHCLEPLTLTAKAMLEHETRWGDDDILKQWAGIFVSYLEREFFNPDERANRLEARLSAVWREVKNEPSRTWGIEELAAMAHMSATHFKRTVRQRYAMPPGRMVTVIRLEKALVLMRGTDLSLDAIATLTGYSTGFALSKAFRRIHGASPRLREKALGILDASTHTADSA